MISAGVISHAEEATAQVDTTRHDAAGTLTLPPMSLATRVNSIPNSASTSSEEVTQASVLHQAVISLSRLRRPSVDAIAR
jgi:hypothetical protein